MIDIDESKLSRIDRLGLAWCRLNCFEWDEAVLGEKPDDEGAVINAMQSIENIIGEANVSRCWNIFCCGKSEEEWFRWYAVDRYALRNQLFDDLPKRV